MKEKILESRLLTDSFNDLVYKTDNNGIITVANKGFSKIFSYSVEELEGMDILNLYVNSSHRDILLCELEKRGGSVSDFIVLVKGKYGRKIYLSVDCNYINGIRNEGIEGIGRDVTLKLDLIGGFFQLSSEGGFIFANEEFVSILDLNSIDEVIGKNIKELNLPQKAFMEMQSFINDTYAEGELRTYDKYIGELTEGTHGILQGYGLLDTQNKICGYEGIIKDCSDKKVLERNMKILEVVGHELLSPTFALEGTIDVLIGGIESKRYGMPKILKKLDDIRLFNRLMEHLVLDINLAGYTTPIDKEPSKFNIKELIKSTIYFLAPIMWLNRIDINCIATRYDSDVSEYIYANKLLILQVFFNIFMNFIKYQEHNTDFQAGIGVKKEKTYYKKGGEKIYKESIIIDIWDSGIGIPEGEEYNIFEPGYKAKNALNYPGKGLGLHVVKTILNKYNGNIFIKNNAKPTIVRICLPHDLFLL